MSVSYLQIPELYTAGFDPNWFVVSSNQAHQTNFRFRTQICDALGNVLREFRNAKDPNYGTLYFDAHRTIENYLSYDISNLIAGTVGWQKGINSFVEYYINVAEEYGASGSISTHASGNSTHIKAINASMEFKNWSANRVSDDYVIYSSAPQQKFLTNQPASIPIRVDDSYELGAVTNVSSVQGIHRLQVKTYNAVGTLLKTGMISNPYGALVTTDQQFLSILVGPKDLNLTTLSAGVQPLIQDTTAYYTIDIINQFGSQKTESKKFTIDRSCTRSGSYNRLYWLNPLGRFDAFNFTQMGDDIIEVEQSRYSRPLGIKTAGSLTFTRSQVESSVFFSQGRQSFKLKSGFITTEVSAWLKELITSPRIYMIIEGYFTPVNLKTNSYQARTTTQEKLFNVELEVELSVPTQRQRL